jgi:hypothetical protein
MALTREAKVAEFLSSPLVKWVSECVRNPPLDSEYSGRSGQSINKRRFPNDLVILCSVCFVACGLLF